MEAHIEAEPASADNLAADLADLRFILTQKPEPGRWEWIWDAFWRLEPDRPRYTQGMAAPMGGSLIMAVPGHMPWTVLDRWCRAHGRSADDRDLMEVCIRKMDDIYLPWWLERHRPRKT